MLRSCNVVRKVFSLPLIVLSLVHHYTSSSVPDFEPHHSSIRSPSSSSEGWYTAMLARIIHPLHAFEARESGVGELRAGGGLCFPCDA